MALRVEKAANIDFCSGVKRVISTLEKIARERGSTQTLGAPIHNEQVLQRLADIGVKVANSLDEIQGETVILGAHGVSPQLEDEIRARCTEVVNTTCPFVRRAQAAARRLAKAGFLVIIYGDANHPEVKGILGWADGKGIATLDDNFITTLESLPRRIGVISQTTQIPARFSQFVKKLVDSALGQNTEIRIIDTICHNVRDRQQAALELASRVDLMLVVGSHTSANTKYLAELCATVCKTYHVATAEEIQLAWFQGHHHVGVIGGASTPGETVDEVIAKLEKMSP